MIYIGTTKDLMEKYSERSKKEIDRTNYVIISSRVRTTRTRDNVLLASNIFLNAGLLRGTNFTDSPDDPQTVEHFKSYILKEYRILALLCSIVECDILENEDTFLFCSPNEWNEHGYLQTIAKTMEELFCYVIKRYPNKGGAIDLKESIKRILYYKENIEKAQIKKAMGVERRKLLEKQDKKKLKGFLKERGLYESSFTRREMIELLVEYF